MTGWGSGWKTERSQRVWVRMNFFPKWMWIGAINFAFILVDEPSFFWIFSGHDVKPHVVKGGPSSPNQCLPGLGQNLLFRLLLGWDSNAMTNKQIFVNCSDIFDRLYIYYILQYIYLGSEHRQPCGMKATETDQSSERGKGKGPTLEAPVLSLDLILLCTSPWNLCHLKL